MAVFSRSLQSLPDGSWLCRRNGTAAVFAAGYTSNLRGYLEERFQASRIFIPAPSASSDSNQVFTAPLILTRVCRPRAILQQLQAFDPIGYRGLGMKATCVLFDFDETLVQLDDFVDWDAAMEAVAKSYIESGVPREVVSRCGSRMAMLSRVFECLVAHYSRKQALSIQRRVSKTLGLFESAGASRAELMPGTKETLVWLKVKRIKVGIHSSNSSDSIRLALKRLGTIQLVDVIVGRSPSLRMKPHPDQLRMCLKKLKCSSQDAVAVGDKTDDMLAAKKLAILAVGVATGKTSKEALLECRPYEVISSLLELREILAPLIQH